MMIRDCSGKSILRSGGDDVILGAGGDGGGMHMMHDAKGCLTELQSRCRGLLNHDLLRTHNTTRYSAQHCDGHIGQREGEAYSDRRHPSSKIRQNRSEH